MASHSKANKNKGQEPFHTFIPNIQLSRAYSSISSSSLDKILPWIVVIHITVLLFLLRTGAITTTSTTITSSTVNIVVVVLAWEKILAPPDTQKSMLVWQFYDDWLIPFFIDWLPSPTPVVVAAAAKAAAAETNSKFWTNKNRQQSIHHIQRTRSRLARVGARDRWWFIPSSHQPTPRQTRITDGAVGTLNSRDRWVVLRYPL